MLATKPWTLEAILRLVLGVIISLSLGSVAVMGLHYAGPLGVRRLFFFALLTGAGLLLIIALFLVSRPWKVQDLLGRMLLLLACIFIGLSLAAGMTKLDRSPPEINASERMVITEATVLVFLILLFLKDGNCVLMTRHTRAQASHTIHRTQYYDRYAAHVHVSGVYGPYINET